MCKLMYLRDLPITYIEDICVNPLHLRHLRAFSLLFTPRKNKFSKIFFEDSR